MYLNITAAKICPLTTVVMNFYSKCTCTWNKRNFQINALSAHVKYLWTRFWSQNDNTKFLLLVQELCLPDLPLPKSSATSGITCSPVLSGSSYTCACLFNLSSNSLTVFSMSRDRSDVSLNKIVYYTIILLYMYYYRYIM